MMSPVARRQHPREDTSSERWADGVPHCAAHFENTCAACDEGVSNRLPMMGRPGGPGGSGNLCCWDKRPFSV